MCKAWRQARAWVKKVWLDFVSGGQVGPCRHDKNYGREPEEKPAKPGFPSTRSGQIAVHSPTCQMGHWLFQVVVRIK